MSKIRVYNLVVHFKDSPTPIYVDGVQNVLTEGGLLRLVAEGSESVWWPLCNVAQIKELGRSKVEIINEDN